MKRILYFSTNYSTHDHRFLTAISGAGHETHFLRLEADRRQVEDRPVPPQVHQVPWAGGRGAFHWSDVPRLARDLKRVIREIQPDLLHAGPIQTCAFLAVLSGFRPLLTMSWGFDLMQDAERNGWWQWVTRYTLRHSTFFTSDANVTRDKAVAYGMDPARTVVFPWGVDLAQFAPSTGQAHEPGSFVLFCNRSWELRYGVDVLTKAFAKVARERPELSLLLLAGGSQAPVLRQTLMNGGVIDQVYFGGQVAQRDLPGWYHQADLYISPSHVDGSSVSLMEALACGKPCLVSDIPANREWVSDGVNGWLFRDGDVEDLAAKILHAMEERDKLAEMGRQARLTAQARADWQKNAAILLQTYESLVSRREAVPDTETT